MMTKHLRRSRLCRIALTALCCLSLLAGTAALRLMNAPAANAGVSKVSIATTDSIRGSIATNIWVVDGGVKDAGGNSATADFDEDCAENARMIAMRSINDISEDGFSKSVEAEYTFGTVGAEYNATYADGARFAFVYGLPNAFAELGAPGSVEVYCCALDSENKPFSSEDLADGTKKIANADLAVGVQRFDENGVAQQIVAPQKFSGVQFGRQNSLRVTIEDGKLTASVKRGALDSSYAWQTVCTSDEEGNEVQAGYTGIGRQGKGRLRLRAVNIDAWDYINAVTPQADSAVEDFSNGSYNARVWYSRAETRSAGGGIYVENDALVLRKLQKGYFGTCHAYSNFELTFEITSVQRKDEVSDGVLVYAKESNAYVGVSLGNEDYNERTYSTAGAQMFTFASDGNVRRYEAGECKATVNLATEEGLSNFWTEEYEGKAVTVKLRVYDGTVTFLYKIEGSENPDDPENGYITLFSVNGEDTPYGYVRILTENATNIIIDNVSIVNLDANAAAVALEVGYAANGLDGVQDYDYTDSWSDNDLFAFAK